MRGLSEHAFRSLSAAVVCPESASIELSPEFALELEAAQQDPDAQLGRYLLLSEVGHGSGGRVYRAYDPVLRRLAAVKKIATKGLDPPTIQRLEQEFIAMAAISHPGVVAVYDAGVDGGELFFAMEWMGDGNLEQKQANAPLDYKQCFELVVGLAGALAATHSAGILHLDIKPTNILFSGSQAKIGDFGAMQRLLPTEPNTRHQIGTVGFMAPEQASGRRSEIDHRCDIFALGKTLAQLLESVEIQTIQDAELQSIVTRATAEFPEDRFLDMHSFAAALASLNNRPPPRPSPKKFLWIGASTILLIAVGVYQAFGSNHKSVEARLAEWDYERALFQLVASPPLAPADDPVWSRHYVRALVGQWLIDFSFHPAEMEQASEFLLTEELASVVSTLPPLATTPLEELSLELATMKVLQSFAEELSDDLSQEFQYLDYAFPHRANPWLLHLAHALHFEEMEVLRGLLRRTENYKNHPAAPGLLALASFANAQDETSLALLQDVSEWNTIFLADVGVCLLFLDRPQEAWKVLEQCIELHPDLATAHHHLAVAALRLGEIERAVFILSAWAEHVSSELDLEWDIEPNVDLSALARSSAIYIWPSTALVRHDPWLADLWQHPLAANLSQVFDE